MITVKPIKKTTIMKKLVFLLVCLFTLQTVARADDDKPIQVTQMPQPAQQLPIVKLLWQKWKVISSIKVMK